MDMDMDVDQSRPDQTILIPALKHQTGRRVCVRFVCVWLLTKDSRMTRHGTSRQSMKTQYTARLRGVNASELQKENCPSNFSLYCPLRFPNLPSSLTHGFKYVTSDRQVAPLSESSTSREAPCCQLWWHFAGDSEIHSRSWEQADLLLHDI